MLVVKELQLEQVRLMKAYEGHWEHCLEFALEHDKHVLLKKYVFPGSQASQSALLVASHACELETGISNTRRNSVGKWKVA